MNTEVQNQIPRWSLTLLLLTAVMMGCRSPNVNPTDAKPNTGYVDFYCPADTNLCWDVKHIKPRSSKTKTLFSEVKPVKGHALRLALPPGHHRLQITFLNRAVTAPAVVDVLVNDGMITPVQVALLETGKVNNRETEVKFRTTVRGFGQAPEVTESPAGVYEITGTVEPPIPYWPKQALAYSN